MRGGFVMNEYSEIDRRNDFDYFLQHYQELYEKYGHKFIAIKNKQILGTYDKELDAIQDAAKTYPFGTFIVQECNGDETGYTNYISSWQLIKV